MAGDPDLATTEAIVGALSAAGADAIELGIPYSDPLAVGFGLSRPADVRELAGLADGVVVGSALIDAYAGTVGADAVNRVSEFVGPLIAAAAR